MLILLDYDSDDFIYNFGGRLVLRFVPAKSENKKGIFYFNYYYNLIII